MRRSIACHSTTGMSSGPLGLWCRVSSPPEKKSPEPRLSFNVKGQRLSDNLAMIDGSMVSETNGAVSFFINPDSVQEFEVKTGLYGAEYGIKSGGQFSLITKSGTNDLHGTLSGFTATTIWTPATSSTPDLDPSSNATSLGRWRGKPLSAGPAKGKGQGLVVRLLQWAADSPVPFAHRKRVLYQFDLPLLTAPPDPKPAFTHYSSINSHLN